MAWALQFDGTTQYIVIPCSSGSVTLSYKMGADFPVTGSHSYVYDGRPHTNTYFLKSLGSPQSNGISNVEINGVPSSLADVFTTLQGDIVSFDVQVGSSFHLLSRYTSPQDCLGLAIEYIELDYGAGVAQRNDATASDHSNTGQQPILVDTVGSNDATGLNFPTDGSAWVDLGGGGSVDGTIAITMSSFTSAGSGNIGEAITGTISELMDDLIINGSGSIGDNPTGTISITMGSATVNAVGNIGEAINGSSSILIADALAVSSGNIGEAVTGTATPQADDFTILGEGTFALAVTGTANIQLDDFVIYGRETQEGGIYGAISAIPIEIEEINAIQIEVITK